MRMRNRMRMNTTHFQSTVHSHSLFNLKYSASLFKPINN